MSKNEKVEVGKKISLKWIKLLNKVYHSNKSEVIEYKLPGKLFSLSISPLKEMGYVNVYGNDITKQRKTEEKIKESEAKFKTLVESSPDCIKLIGLDGKLLYMSPSGLKEHGLKKPEDAIGWDFSWSIIKEHRLMFKDAFKRALKGKTTTIEVKHLPEKATRDWCLVTLAPVKSKGGKINYVFGVSRDISELKRSNPIVIKQGRKLKEQKQKYEKQIAELKNKIK